ncbi:MAG: leucine-rich repeat domain-containing protein [Planctomycetaceae bacterium]
MHRVLIRRASSPWQSPAVLSRRAARSWVVIIVCCVGCGPNDAPSVDAVDTAPPPPPPEAPTPTAPARKIIDDPRAMTIAELRERLHIGNAGEIQKVGGQIVAMDLRGTGVKDISVLKGLPLRELYLEQNPITDITALAGMPLDKLYLDDTKVTDLTPLTGMKLTELNLSRAPVSDLAPLTDVEFGTLWIPETQVSDLTPLAGKLFVSLDLRATPVSDLSPLAGNTSLRRLHIAETKVTDVTPLAGLQLERLAFTPGNMIQGLDFIRGMSSLTGLDTHFEGGQIRSPEEFWNLYEAGDLDDSEDTPQE